MPEQRPEIPQPSSLIDLAALRRRAEGLPITSRMKDGTEIWWCDELDGEYLGWQDAEIAKAKGVEGPKMTPPLPELLALVEAVEAARAVVWRKEPDGSITVVSGLEQLEVNLWAFT